MVPAPGIFVTVTVGMNMSPQRPGTLSSASLSGTASEFLDRGVVEFNSSDNKCKDDCTKNISKADDKFWDSDLL